MRKIYCDKCGKEMPEETIRKVTIQEVKGVRELELCPACKEEVVELLKSKGGG